MLAALEECFEKYPAVGLACESLIYFAEDISPTLYELISKMKMMDMEVMEVAVKISAVPVWGWASGIESDDDMKDVNGRSDEGRKS